MARNNLPTLLLLPVLLLSASGLFAQPDVPASPQTGRYTTTFTERSPLSTMDAVIERFRVNPQSPPGDYAIEDESFEVYVPGAYDGTQAYGLFVWIDAGQRGGPRGDYLPVLDEHKLIWVGANGSGNDRSFWHRAGLALDGRHNIMRDHHIDPMRVYVSGVSGGGRSASRVGPTYADLFAGAYPIIGVDFFTRIPHPDSTELRLTFWGPAFNPPQPNILRRAKRDGRYVLLTGETDGNRPQTLLTFQYGYERAGFKHVTYLEVPGMGHTMPPAEWFEKGIEALDAPLAEIRERREADAKRAYDEATYRLRKSPEHGVKALEKLLQDFNDTTYAALAEQALRDGPPVAEATDADQITADTDTPTEAIDPLIKARENLALARNYLNAGRPDLARDLLESVINNHPDTEEAEQAEELLQASR